MSRFRTVEYALGWLAGMIDGEGTVGRFGKGQRSRTVKICNTDPDLIAATCEALDLAGITSYTVQTRAQQGAWPALMTVVVFGRENFERLFAQVQLMHPRKQQTLSEIPSSYLHHRFDRDELHRLFIIERKSQAEIARLLGVRKSNIQYAVKRYGLAISQSEKISRGWTEERRARQSASMKQAHQRKPGKW